MADAICWVVRDVTGETQLSVRFTLLRDARDFADKCVGPVRIWKLVRKHREPEPLTAVDLTAKGQVVSLQAKEPAS